MLNKILNNINSIELNLINKVNIESSPNKEPNIILYSLVFLFSIKDVPIRIFAFNILHKKTLLLDIILKRKESFFSK